MLRNTFAGKSTCEKECSEAREVRITSVLFLRTTPQWLRRRICASDERSEG